MGLSSVYTPEVVAQVLAALSAGESVASICKQDWAPAEATFYQWLAKHQEFRAAYETAKAVGVERLANEILDIADSCAQNKAAINKARMRIGVRQWTLVHLLPKKYGDHVDVKHSGGVTVEVLRFSDKPGNAAG